MHGAVAVLNQKGLPSKVPASRFPQELQTLQPHEIEDCLCIYKAEFQFLRTGGVP